MREKYRNLQDHYQQDGVAKATRVLAEYAYRKFVRNGVRRLVRPIYQPPSVYVHSRYSHKLNVFNEEWDLLVILDTCRPDAIARVADEFDFITEVDSRWSVGATSYEWIANTFDRRFRDTIAETAYVTSNPHAVTVFDQRLERNHRGRTAKKYRRLARYGVTRPVSSDAFHTYRLLYDERSDYGAANFPSPRSVTDHTITVAREDDPKRIISHYMPPHEPYFVKSNDGALEFVDERPPTFDAYLDNLRWALTEVELLLENVDRKRVVISADHGENFLRLGGLRSNHTLGMVAPSVRRVPWVVTEATDSGTHRPDVDDTAETAEYDVDEVLEALGYRR